MAYTPPTYTPSGSLFGTSPATTPYTYGNLAPTTSSYNVWGSHGSPLGNPYLIAGPTYTPGSGAPIVPRPVTPSVPVQQSGGGGDSDYSDSGTTSSPYGLQDHLGDYYDRPGWSYAVPGVSSIYGLTDLAHGINPLNFTGQVPDGSQTFGWYGGDTDYFGNPVTNSFAFNTLEGGANGYSASNQGEADIVSEYGWGSDEHFDSLDNDPYGGSGGGNVYTGPMLNAWGSAQDPIAIQAQQLIETTNANAAAATQAEADAAQAAAQAEAAAHQEQLDIMYNATNNQIDSLNTQLTNLIDTSNNQYSQLTAAQQNQYNSLLGQLETVEGSLTQQIADSYNGPYNNQSFYTSLTPTAEQLASPSGYVSGYWSNPAAGVDTSTLGGSTGTTGLNGAPAPTVSWSDTPNSAGNTTGTFTSNEMGSTNVTDYGGGSYSVDVGEVDEVGWEDPGGDSGGGGGGGGGSYIATAATQSLGTAGLTVFNNWRDYMHTWHPTFTTSFGRYRVTAPKIVKVIDSKDNSEELYKEIWEEHLKPIYNLIVNKDDDKALVKYKLMVKELMNKYLKGDK
jgi:hypothetical protein